MNFFLRNPGYCAKHPAWAWRATRAHRVWVVGKICAWCGGTDGVEAHDVIPTRELKTLAQALDSRNWWPLCRKMDCHRSLGHMGNYTTGINPVVREDCDEHHRLMDYRRMGRGQ